MQEASTNDKVESLDTSVLMRIIRRDDEEMYRKACNLIYESDQRFFISDMVFQELIYLLTKNYDVSRKTTAVLLTDLFIMQKNIDCNQMLILQVLEDMVQHPKLSFEDCYLARKAEINDMRPLWTFDKKLSSQMETAVLVK